MTPEEFEATRASEDRKDMRDKIKRDEIVKLVNNYLTDDIRCLGFRVVTKRFDIKLSAFSRRYEYLCPLKMFYKYDKDTFPTCRGTDETVNSEILETLKKYVAKFVGTHNFHNFTRKGNPKEKQSIRYIISMEVERVPSEELKEIMGEEEHDQYIRFKLHGQSFIYHQIRKMIGSLIQIYHQDLDESFLDNAFTYNKTPIWLAPSQGLLLDKVVRA